MDDIHTGGLNNKEGPLMGKIQIYMFPFALYSYTVDWFYSLEILLISPKLDQFGNRTTLYQAAVYHFHISAP